MKARGRQLAVAVTFALCAVLILASLSSSAPVFDDEDSPWPETDALQPNVRAVNEVVDELEAKVELMELSAARYADWEACLHGVPISEYGDPDRQFGYGYDERDGTGPNSMPALAVDRKSRPRHEDYLFLDFASGGDCRTTSPKPGGTAESASAWISPPAHLRPLRAAALHARRELRGRGGLPGELSDLESRVESLTKSAARLETSSERFDEWESCVSWVPVTEYGDPEGKFGYMYGASQAPPSGYLPALAIDRSDWEDPEYMFLALVGGDRPGHTCQDEPGEAVD